jgi:branched-chain amino acid transport system permease protein
VRDASPLARTRRRLAGVALAWALFAAWPFVAPNDYLTSLGVAFFVNLLLIAGLNLVMGWGGQISLCQAGFFGLGAYASGVLAAKIGWPAWSGLLAAPAVAAACALVIGLPALRLRGHYLAMATLGFNAILTVLFVELVPLTGGPNGLSGIPPIAIGPIVLDGAARFYWLVWLAGGACMLLLAFLVGSRMGRALRAVAGSELAAAAMGIDPFRTKLAAFVLSAAIAGVAGSLYAHFNQYASPETFGVSASVLLVVMVALGGWGHYWGPVFGAAVYTAVPELLRRFHDAELLAFGAGMLVVLLFLPEGIAGLGEPRTWRARRARADAAGAARDGATTREAT